MKRILAGTAAVAMLLAASASNAQYHGYDQGHRDHHGRGYDHDRGYDRGHDDRHGGWHGNRGNYRHYARGQRWRGDGAYFNDWRRYGYRAPPRGYRYYRSNSGDIVLAAIATGVIASVIADNHRH